jgi:hypothetical protein
VAQLTIRFKHGRGAAGCLDFAGAALKIASLYKGTAAAKRRSRASSSALPSYAMLGAALWGSGCDPRYEMARS